jgi:hypothetical protein
MRFIGSVMAICAVCAAMLTMTTIRRRKMMASPHKRHGMMQKRHGMMMRSRRRGR